MIEQLSHTFSNLTIYAVFVIGILIVRSNLPKTLRPVVYLFLLSLISFLYLEQVPAGWQFEVVVSLTFLLPYSVWQLSRGIFSDKTLSLLKLSSYAIIVIVWYHTCALSLRYEPLSQYVGLTMRLTTISFLALSVIESQRGKKDDLVSGRLKLRKVFIYFVAIVGLITVLTETSLGRTDFLTLKMVQRAAIFVFSTYFLIVNTRWQDTFFGKVVKQKTTRNEGLINRINELMADHQYYKQEGLTIGQLAQKLGEQEYKLRTVINQEMGYRNFPAFVNSFRLEEARILLKQEDKTIQEIAFAVGFNSIGPFNRAFKAQSGITPKAFRDQD